MRISIVSTAIERLLRTESIGSGVAEVSFGIDRLDSPVVEGSTFQFGTDLLIGLSIVNGL